MAPRRLLLLAPTFSLLSFVFSSSPPPFTGSGSGDAAEWLAALNTAYSSWSPTPHLQDVTQLYKPDWNSFVEGPTWTDWWTQNSYGPSFAALPFLRRPSTALRHRHRRRRAAPSALARIPERSGTTGRGSIIAVW